MSERNQDFSQRDPETAQLISQIQHISSNKLLRWPAVKNMTGISRTTAWRLEKSGEFPKRVQVSKGIVAWQERDVIEFINSRRKISLEP